MLFRHLNVKKGQFRQRHEFHRKEEGGGIQKEGLPIGQGTTIGHLDQKTDYKGVS